MLMATVPTFVRNDGAAVNGESEAKDSESGLRISNSGLTLGLIPAGLLLLGAVGTAACAWHCNFEHVHRPCIHITSLGGCLGGLKDSALSAAAAAHRGASGSMIYADIYFFCY